MLDTELQTEKSQSEQILENLNPAQKEAVVHGSGPLLIVAGAGTGKTTVLTKRIAYLIAQKAALPSEILALTFTDKAAHEMEERVDKLVPYGFNDVWISTFHSFGDRILREYAFEIGLSPNLNVLTIPEAVVFFRQHLFDFKLKHYRPLSDPTKFIESLLTTFSRAKDEDVSAAEFLSCAERRKEKAQTDLEKDEAEKIIEVAQAFQTYEALKTQYGFIDFGDQVVLALKILRERPAVLKKFQQRFKYILVDEFQDTNYAQFALLKLLAEFHQNITVVGDDDQSIYKFRGACLSNILGFQAWFPKAKEMILQDNYRSTQDILDLAYQLIKHNNPDRLEYHSQISKLLYAHKRHGKKVVHVHFDTLFSEAEHVASEIKSRIEKGENEPKEFAILVRTNASAEPFLKHLSYCGVPWRFSGNAGLYEQEEIRTILAFLRAVDQPDDSASLYYLATSSLYQLDGEACSILTQFAARANRSLWDSFKICLGPGAAEGPKISPETAKKIAALVEDIKKFRMMATKAPTGKLLYLFLEEKGVLKNLAEMKDPQAYQKGQNLARFFDIIKRFGHVSEYDRVHTFIETLEALRTAGEDPSSAEASFDENAVNVLTVHAAKGLEFSVVFLVGLEQGHFPTNEKKEAFELPEELIKDVLPSGNFHIQEERRLFYVGMTRAKEELILASAKDMGKKKMWKVSQFLLEAMDKLEANITALKTHPIESLKIYAAPLQSESPALNLAPKTMPVSFLQATAVEEYLTCPLKYKFARRLKIPVLMHHSTVFGIAIHEALKTYNLARREKRKIGVEEVIGAFKAAWKSEGFVSREHEEKRLQEGIQVLKACYKKEEESPVVPAYVEEDFKIWIDQIPIRGRWDRVDQEDQGAAIIDYKTGDVKDQKDADKKAKESLQLSLYALAYQNRFGQLPAKTVLSFVKVGWLGTYVPSEEKGAKTLETAREVIKKISQNQFDPTPSFRCRWCAFDKICPAAEK